MFRVDYLTLTESKKKYLFNEFKVEMKKQREKIHITNKQIHNMILCMLDKNDTIYYFYNTELYNKYSCEYCSALEVCRELIEKYNLI